MKTTVVTIAGLAAVASAQSLCAVNCFQSVTTEHPPLDCKEANMYLCFCKGKDLQNFFAQCAYSKCASDAENAINFGVSLCKDMGVPIVPPARPSSSSTAQQPPSSAKSSTPVAATSRPASSAVETTLVTTGVASKSSSATSLPTSSHAAESSVVLPSSTKRVSTPTNGTSTQPSPTNVVVNKGVSLKTVPGALVIAGLGAAAFQML
ncbi:hypothetical protein JDV02_005511 [Purpureocillium takamizusanense]|uniref:CFEM domain-containing protein n=1 Tax=Purpureocillium takamizusanense TaxID=2060973 RepID=A0A9Q8QGR2_9HYPO|nr:uncharacterized protein JDV02_005511 [Purpureocillium takamizusanense]UNI19320.1 hypothetical protein JDV02_005511 [Purpureocillium takamizusanense]